MAGCDPGQAAKLDKNVYAPRISGKRSRTQSIRNPPKGDTDMTQESWREIEDGAPRDGTRVLLWCADETTKGLMGAISVGWFSTVPPAWVHGHSYGPTHWRPLPAPPTNTKGE